ncbi:MAG TPA: riboflavin synthase [Candidatus Acidoferrum sp.]|nr:riboflavin synthase [Candidatus Acidoferrum sp.]
MFTGIIEHLGTIEYLEIRAEGPNAGGRISIHAPKLTPKLTVSQSVAVNGCCLTVVSLSAKSFGADLSGETVRKTSFGARPPVLKAGSTVNLEQALTAGKEFGGHIVQGHVDTVGHVTQMQREGENWRMAVQVPEDFARYVVPQGSVTIDGISLTVAGWRNRIAEIAVIPYTYAHTNLCERKPGDAVNLEADVLGKYIEQHLTARKAPAPESKLTVEELIKQGW